MEVIRTSSAVILLIGWFWGDIEKLIFKNIKNKIYSTAKTSIEEEEEEEEDDHVVEYGAISHGYMVDSAGIDDDDDACMISNINMLSDDIMMQILCRFPPETLIKYKGVSSSWCRLIIELCNHRLIPKDGYPFSGFIFSMGGFLGYPTPRGMWYCHGRSSLQQKQKLVAQSFLAPLPCPSSPHDNRELLDCCNGLLLFRHSSLYTTPKYIVCNPTTSEHVEIMGKTFDTHDAIGALAFNPCESNHYKIVLIIPNRHCAHLKIFSSETGKWTKSKFVLQKNFNLTGTQSVYLEGTLLKLSLSSGHLMRIFINKQVSKIDRVQSIDLPLARLVLVSFRRECIGLHNGHILQYALYNGEELLIFTLEHTSGNIYGSLNKDDLYWSLKHNISVRTTNNFLQPHEQNPFMWSKIYAFYPDSDVIVMGYRKVNSRFSIYCYNYKLQRIEEHTKLLNFKVREDDNLLVFPFARCFLSLPKCKSEVVLAGSKMCGDNQNFGTILSSRYSKEITRKSDGFYFRPATICHLPPIAYL